MLSLKDLTIFFVCDRIGGNIVFLSFIRLGNWVGATAAAAAFMAGRLMSNLFMVRKSGT